MKHKRTSVRRIAQTLALWPLSVGMALLVVPDVEPGNAQSLRPYYDLPVAQHPESVTYDPVERAFYAGSSLGKGVVKFDGVSGAIRQFVAVSDLPFSAITGLRVDPVRRQLWLCNVEPAAFVAYVAGGGPAEAVQSGLARIDLNTGSLLSYTFLATIPGIGAPGYACNDIAVDDAGRAYATESLLGRVIQAEPDGSRTALIIVDPRLARNAALPGSLGINGIAFSPVDGNVYMTNPANGRFFRFPHNPDISRSVLREVLLSEPVNGDGLMIDPVSGAAYAVAELSSGDRVVKRICVPCAPVVKPVSQVPWPVLPRSFEIPTAGTYAEGRFFVADAALRSLQNPLTDTQPGLVFGVDLPP